ncbi:VQ motif-containing protein 4 [Striga hermonthica]|uniref:VQ motif-containing protein 4 n=1 Tax=Striga hermonthica TaxID=68872 RepID=A0A9N7R6X5_STRHE|nr:VQ motif-containing protein 4 [Striga hermonthica]
METASLNLPAERVTTANCNGQPAPPPLTPSSNPRSNDAATNNCSTTFVQADAATFKQVVQMLTAARPPSRVASGIPPAKTAGQKRQGFRLYERRNNLKNGLMIDTIGPGPHRGPMPSPRKPELLSPSMLDFPGLALSPASEDAPSPEDRAIAEKKFYFHPSPRAVAAGDAEPKLLPLFPVTSPRISGSS